MQKYFEYEKKTTYADDEATAFTNCTLKVGMGKRKAGEEIPEISIRGSDVRFYDKDGKLTEIVGV